MMSKLSLGIQRLIREYYTAIKSFVVLTYATDLAEHIPCILHTHHTTVLHDSTSLATLQIHNLYLRNL
jgi:hypothetical protein